jgi:geranylgeranylglycerol-phosphate geranylgeranyltransferase
LPNVRGAGASIRTMLRAHVETWRPYTLWYVGLVSLGGAALAGGTGHPWRLLAAWAAPTAGWLGGHYLGDYFDRELDAGSKPHRPIPSGRLSPRAALVCGGFCFIVLAALAVVGSWGTMAAAVVGACGIVAYSRWLKARGVAGNLVRGALGAVALLYGAAAAGRWPDPAVLALLSLLAVVFWLHDTVSNLVGTLRDVDGDQAGGFGTLPVRRGTPFAVWTAISLYTAMIAAALPVGPLVGAGARLAYLITLGAVVVLGAVALAPLIGRRADLSVIAALRAHEVLVVERVVLASAVVGLGLGVRWQLGLVVPMAALSWWTQSAMRARHELGTTRTVPSVRVSVEDAR